MSQTTEGNNKISKSTTTTAKIAAAAEAKSEADVEPCIDRKLYDLLHVSPGATKEEILKVKQRIVDC